MVVLKQRERKKRAGGLELSCFFSSREDVCVEQ